MEKVWDSCKDDSSGLYTPYFDAEKLRHCRSGSLHMPVIDLGGLPKPQFSRLPVNDSGNSGSIYYPQEEVTESVVPCDSISELEPLHLRHEGLHPTSLDLDDLFTNHGWSDWTDPRELTDLWNDFPVCSYAQEMVAVSPANVGWDEGSSHPSASEHEMTTSTRIRFEVEGSPGGCGDPILRDRSRSTTGFDYHRQHEALLKAAEPSTLETKCRELEATFVSQSPSEKSPPTVCCQPEAVALLNSRCITQTPTSASVTPPTIVRKTTKASREVRRKSACAPVQTSRLRKGTSTGSPTKRSLPPRKPPSKVLKRRGEVPVNFPENQLAEAKPSSTKDRNGPVEAKDHVERERNRRDVMAGRLAELEDLLPAATYKRDRVTIVNDTVECITSLQKKVQVLRERYQILAAAKRKTEVYKDPVKILRSATSANVEFASQVPISATSKAMKTMDTVCRKPMITLPQLRISKTYKQPVLDIHHSFTISPEKSVDVFSNQDRKTVYVEFYMQIVDSAMAQAPEVIRCQCKVNYMSSTMRTLEDMKLDVCRCSVTKMENYVMCVLFLKTRSDVSNYPGTLMTTQFAARLKYNQSLNVLNPRASSSHRWPVHRPVFTEL